MKKAPLTNTQKRTQPQEHTKDTHKERTTLSLQRKLFFSFSASFFECFWRIIFVITCYKDFFDFFSHEKTLLLSLFESLYLFSVTFFFSQTFFSITTVFHFCIHFLPFFLCLFSASCLAITHFLGCFGVVFLLFLWCRLCFGFDSAPCFSLFGGRVGLFLVSWRIFLRVFPFVFFQSFLCFFSFFVACVFCVSL